MDRDLYQKMLVDLVLPDIKKKMPATAGNINKMELNNIYRKVMRCSKQR
jgi:hypothetical protein